METTAMACTPQRLRLALLMGMPSSEESDCVSTDVETLVSCRSFLSGTVYGQRRITERRLLQQSEKDGLLRTSSAVSF